MHYTYTRGEWTSGSTLPEWIGTEEFDDYLRRIKFKTTPMRFGGDELSQIQVYESEEKPIFMAEVTLTGNIYNVYLPDFPSMMMFVRDHAAAFSVEAANSYQQEILQIMQKFFQAVHGHDALNICKECDPHGWQIHMDKARKK